MGGIRDHVQYAMPSILEIAALIQCQVALLELELAKSEAEVEERRKNTEVTINLFDLDDRIKRLYGTQVQQLEDRIATLEGSIRRLEEQHYGSDC
jgi:TolA-binding protein